jgi:uncharacterized membrane protein
VTNAEKDVHARGVERLTFFSDAVVAIAITLLAIDMPVPGGDTAAALWASVRHEDGHYAAFLISFLVIAASWSQHHRMFNYAERADELLRRLNLAWLFTIILIPFATKLLTVKGDPTTAAHALRFGFYALLEALESGVMLAMLRRLARLGHAAGLPPAVASSLTRQSWGLIIGFGVSIPVFFATKDAWILWFVTPALAGQLSRRRVQPPDAVDGALHPPD